MPVQQLDTLRSDLAAMRAQRMTWREIAAKYPGAPAGTLCAISKGREPQKASVRRALGLPVLAEAPACPKCGVVHVRKTCPAKSGLRRPRARPTPRQKRLLKIMGMLWGGK